MLRLIFLAAQIIVLFAACVFAAHAQSRSGDLRGVVSDQKGGLIIGAKATLTNSEKEAREVVSGERGEFQFDALNVGVYKLKVTAYGFAEHEEIIALDAAKSALRIAVTLYPAISETVNVEENAN